MSDYGTPQRKPLSFYPEIPKASNAPTGELSPVDSFPLAWGFSDLSLSSKREGALGLRALGLRVIGV